MARKSHLRVFSVYQIPWETEHCCWAHTSLGPALSHSPCPQHRVEAVPWVPQLHSPFSPPWTQMKRKPVIDLVSKEIKPVNPKGNQPQIFIGRIDAETEAPILWPHDAKSRCTGKYPYDGRTEGKRRRGRQRTRWLDGITDSVDMNLSKLQ